MREPAEDLLAEGQVPLHVIVVVHVPERRIAHGVDISAMKVPRGARREASLFVPECNVAHMRGLPGLTNAPLRYYEGTTTRPIQEE